LLHKEYEVCSPFTKEINRAISILGYNPKIIILNPSDISDILDNIYEVSKNVGKIKEGQNLVKSLEDKINRIKVTELKNKNKNLPKIFMSGMDRSFFYCWSLGS
jgi:iron complex transport system substrate-binding protein